MLSDIIKTKILARATVLKLLKFPLLWAVQSLSKGKLSSHMMESWIMKQKPSYVGHLYPKYLALTVTEAGILSETHHTLLWLVNASGVLRSFAGNMGTILALRDKRQIHFASGMKNSLYRP